MFILGLYIFLFFVRFLTLSFFISVLISFTFFFSFIDGFPHFCSYNCFINSNYIFTRIIFSVIFKTHLFHFLFLREKKKQTKSIFNVKYSYPLHTKRYFLLFCYSFLTHFCTQYYFLPHRVFFNIIPFPI